MTSVSDKRILCVGLTCLDIITICDGYPEEDSDQKCIDQLWQRGGNASNSCTAIALLGQNVEYLGVITSSKEQRFLSDDMETFGIHADHCVIKPELQTPTSTIISNIKNASRTILACQRNLPEVTAEEFSRIDLNKNQYKWIHFEGRPNVAEIKKMLREIADQNKSAATCDRVMTSVELEKRRPELLELLNEQVDVVFVSKEFAVWQDCTSMTDAVQRLQARCKYGSTVICPWGELGAAAKSSGDQKTVTSPVYPPDTLVDTLAAGDTFIGSTIVALSNHQDLQSAITFGCKVAGTKCGVRGWAGMAEKLKRFQQELR